MTRHHPAPAPPGPTGRPLSPTALAAGPDTRAGHTWLVETFVRRTPGVTHAQVSTADGLVLAAATRQPPEPPDHPDRLAALAAGLTSIAHAAAHTLHGHLLQTTLDLDTTHLVLRPLPGRAGGAVLALTRPDADTGDIGYELTLLARRIHRTLHHHPDDPHDRSVVAAVTTLR